MIDKSFERDEQWTLFLSRTYGEANARPAFKTELLAELKAKQSEILSRDENISPEEEKNWAGLLGKTYPAVAPRDGFKASLLGKLKTSQTEIHSAETAVSPEEEGNWSRLLTAAYGECDPNPDFKTGLLANLKERHAARATSGDADQFVLSVENIITKAYVPVEPNREFQTRLLNNLKERQKTTVMIKEEYRKRSIFSSFVSGLAAAAAVAFVVWLAPMDFNRAPVAVPMLSDRAHEESDPAIVVQSPVEIPAPRQYEYTAAIADIPADSPQTASLTRNAASVFAEYNVDAAFASPVLPKTVRGIGMQINDGSGWREMDESLLTRLSPGMAFRSTRQTAGLGFSDGSTLLMWPDAVISAGENGFAVEQGQLAVTVPAGGEQRFHLNLPERDIVVEPGTMLAVNAFYPGDYAVGGAPAPEVKVLDGGLAVAKGKNGAAPLLANQVYLIDRYITPDIPGRPICAAETAELGVYEMPAGLNPQAAFDPSRLVANDGMMLRSSSSTPNGYVRKSGKWVANTYNDQPLVRVRYLSDEYFGLANSRRDLGSALAVGPEAIIDAGEGVFYDIHR